MRGEMAQGASESCIQDCSETRQAAKNAERTLRVATCDARKGWNEAKRDA
jgi:hypothetical protein